MMSNIEFWAGCSRKFEGLLYCYIKWFELILISILGYAELRASFCIQLQLKYLAEEMQAISKGLEKVIQELSASENDGPVSEYFCQVHSIMLSI